MRTVARSMIVLLFLAMISALQLSGAEAKPSLKTNAPADALFSQQKVLRLKIEIPSANLDALKKQPKTYVKGLLKEEDQIYSDIGIRLKGSASFDAQQKKPSLVIKFNEFTSGKLFHGHSRILLDNAHQDRSYLSQAVGSEIFKAANVPAPKVTFARVEFNGRDLGLYVVEQAVNREFLSEHFKKNKGNLYEGSHADVSDKLEKDSGDDSTDQPDLKKLVAAAKEPDPSQRLKKLGALVDLDAFISFAAAEVLTWHHTGYTMDRNNYRIYHDPGTERMVFIPHSLDELFIKTNGPLFPEWKGLVAKAVLESPEGQTRYRARLSALLAGPCTVDFLHKRVTELAGQVRPSLSQDSVEGNSFEKAVALLKDRIAQRSHFLEEELKKSGK